MPNANAPLLREVEGLILSSQILSFEDKKKMLVRLDNTTEAQLLDLKVFFEKEATEVQRIRALETHAWQELKNHLASIVVNA
ncbi:hypothetical protein KBD59_00205 [Candidatus Gracilibacteria bacterium]|nr:hypothetical protein [Candidatus Gracilibacteria bacterium]